MCGSARCDVPKNVLPRSEVADIANMRLAASTEIIHSTEKPNKPAAFDPEQYSAIQFDQNGAGGFRVPTGLEELQPAGLELLQPAGLELFQPGG
eukprot:gene3886-biopygen11352